MHWQTQELKKFRAELDKSKGKGKGKGKNSGGNAGNPPPTGNPHLALTQGNGNNPADPADSAAGPARGGLALISQLDLQAQPDNALTQQNKRVRI